MAKSGAGPDSVHRAKQRAFKLWEFLGQNKIEDNLQEFDEASESMKGGVFVEDKLPCK